MSTFRSTFAPTARALALLAFAALPLAAQNAIEVSFVRAGTLTQELGTVSVEVEISRASALPVVVPVRLDLENSTATRRMADNDEGDFSTADPSTLPENITWNEETLTYTLTFRPGASRRIALPIQIIQDNRPEEDETVRLVIDAANVTGARPIPPLDHVITIQDDDPLRARFQSLRQTVREGGIAQIGVFLSTPAPAPNGVTINFQFEYDTAESKHISTAGLPEGNPIVIGAETTTGSLRVAAGATTGSFQIPTTQNTVVDGDRRFFVRMVNATIDATSDAPKIDNEAVEVMILDDDPTVASIFLASDASSASRGTETISEFGTYTMTVALTSAPGQAVTIPVQFSGTATRGTDANTAGADYFTGSLSEASELVIAADRTSNTFTVSVIDDFVVEEDETITMTLGTPRLADGGTLALGSSSQFTLVIEDNDPVQLGFAKFDANAGSNAGGDAFIPATSGTVVQRDGGATLFVRLSDLTGAVTAFDFQILSEGTTAKLRDGRVPLADQEWDFFVSLPNGVALAEFDSTRRIGIAGGGGFTGLNLVFNSEPPPPVPYDGVNPPVLPEDKVIRFRISNPNTDDSGVTLFPETEYTLTLRQLADLDVTDLFTVTRKTGNDVPRNPFTSLHELEFAFAPPANLNPDHLRGYRSYKVLFPTGRFVNFEDFDASENDPSFRIGTGNADAFFFAVEPPYRPRYASGREIVVLREGIPVQGNNRFVDANADVVFEHDFFLRPLDLPVIDPITTPARENLHGPGEDFDFFVEFANAGNEGFDLTRLEGQNAPRVLLTRQAPISPSGGTPLRSDNILRFIELEDGSMLFEVRVTNSNLYVEYMDEDGIWRSAQPGTLRSLGSRLYWIDHGYPRTRSHPKDQPMRLYRFFQTNN